MDFLEDFRGDDLNKFALSLNTKPPLFNYTAYNEYSILAYRYMMQNLADLEASEGVLNYGLQNVPSIAMWYNSMNSFLNTLLKITCIRSNLNYVHAYSLPLKERFLLTIKLLNIETGETEKDQLAIKLNEFEQFFNSINFDFFEQDKKVYSKTEFSGSANFINQTDVLQAFLIAYEIFESFRNVVTGLDLMPYISVLSGDKKMVFERLNVLLQKVLAPSVKDILSKHKLKMKLNLSEKFVKYPISGLFQKKEVLAIFKYQSKEIYKIPLNPTKTTIIGGFHDLLIKKYKGKEDQYKMNFMTADF